MSGTWWGAFALVAAVSAGTRETPERPFDVFVFARPTGEPEKDRDLARAAVEVRKRILSRKSWFRSAETENDADVVVEVLDHSVNERLTMWASTGTMRGEAEGATRYSITKQHFLEARVRFQGQDFNLRGIDTTKNGSLKGAATSLALELEKECEARTKGLALKPNPKSDLDCTYCVVNLRREGAEKEHGSESESW